MLDWHGTRLAFDPNLSPRCTIVRRALELTVAPEELGALDAVVVTHAHYDHLDRPTIERLPAVRRIVLPSGSEPYVAGWRRDAEVVGLAVGASLRVGALELVAVPAFHHGNRFHPLASARLAVGWIVRPLEGSSRPAIYVAGDTGRANDFAAIGREFRPTLALLPIGAFLPPWPIGRVHLSPEQAVAVARELGAPLVVPYHFGTFALALDRPGSALPRFARAARAAGLRWAMPELLRGPGRGSGGI